MNDIMEMPPDETKDMTAVEFMTKLLTAQAELLDAVTARLNGAGGWLTIMEAAERGGFSPAFVRRMIKEGKLFASYAAHAWRIPLDHFDVQIAMEFPKLDGYGQDDLARRALDCPKVTTLLPKPAREKSTKLFGGNPPWKVSGKGVGKDNGKKF